LSIHQAKGLVIPLVIVDVGSEFISITDAEFKRFPEMVEKRVQWKMIEKIPQFPLPDRGALDEP
jgi:hypothetical protein